MTQISFIFMRGMTRSFIRTTFVFQSMGRISAGSTCLSDSRTQRGWRDTCQSAAVLLLAPPQKDDLEDHRVFSRRWRIWRFGWCINNCMIDGINFSTSSKERDGFWVNWIIPWCKCNCYWCFPSHLSFWVFLWVNNWNRAKGACNRKLSQRASIQTNS